MSKKESPGKQVKVVQHETEGAIMDIERREVSFQIPEPLVKEFAKELRIVIRHPWIIGIPIPERLRPDVLKDLRDMDVIITPKQMY